MSITIHPRNDFDTELNLSNANFRILSQLLELQSNNEDCGSIDPCELEINLKNARNEMSKSASEWERSYSETTGEKGARIIELPLRSDQIARYFDKLDEIILVAKEQNVTIEWA